MIRIITAFLIGIIIGSLAMFLFLSPQIQKLAGEQIKIEAFSECVNQKIMGQGEYQELMLMDVINCYQNLNQQTK